MLEQGLREGPESLLSRGHSEIWRKAPLNPEGNKLHAGAPGRSCTLGVLQGEGRSVQRKGLSRTSRLRFVPDYCCTCCCLPDALRWQTGEGGVDQLYSVHCNN
jgi:hypothetical protein